MSGLSQGVALLGGVLGLALLVSAAWVVVRASNKDARIKRLQDENADYLKRLDYIEPRFAKAEQQNRLLLEMHNPSDQIEALRQQEQGNHDRTVEILTEQAKVLKQIESRVKSPRSGGG
jgi:hypothetical protein